MHCGSRCGLPRVSEGSSVGEDRQGELPTPREIKGSRREAARKAKDFQAGKSDKLPAEDAANHEESVE
jgi:hypothetical protein